MKNRIRLSAMTLGLCMGMSWNATDLKAQSKLYPTLFDLQEVTIEEGVFYNAMTLNYNTLLQYDTDRLLTPYMRQAGFKDWETLHPNFSNWGSGNFRLDGHVGGHYLSALALAYASCRDTQMRDALKARMDYMVDKMAECQSAFDENTEGLYGYIGGLPDNNVWTGIYKGDISAYNNNRGNVPLYTVHKIYAGLRDAWLYGNNEKAKECFLKLCDWGINLISNIDDATLQSILDTEHGGINEMYADAYSITGEEKYLDAAYRFSHKTMADNMQSLNHSFLDNKHANTQVPKYIGFARIAQVENSGANSTSTNSTSTKADNTSNSNTRSGNARQYMTAAENFWKDVVYNRTVALGGNSISEHFLPDNRCSEYISNPDGPESCNTNNMLKLTEDLFADNRNPMYADFYEQAMLNHILSTQNPNTGGYVYFTSLRPQHYRMYSQVNQGMWCCVGTGMENHSKYGEFIYARSLGNDTLYVNLFVSSTLDDEKFAVSQSTGFPYGEKSEITVNKDGEYTMAIRKPQWCRSGFGITVNGTQQQITEQDGRYIGINRAWKKGDRVEISFPMQMEMVECPNYPQYIAFRYGPVLLGAITGTDNLAGQFAGEGRMDHAPSQGAQKTLTSAPMLIGERDKVLEHIYPTDKEKLQFKIKKELYNNERFADLTLQPFFNIHEARYMIYWNQLTEDEWNSIKDEVMAEEQITQQLNDRTLDFVATGEQQSDAGHVLEGEYEKGSYSGEFYVDALKGKWFSYQLATKGVKDSLSLMCRFHSADAGRVATIYINEKKFLDIQIEERAETGFYNVEYPIPSELITGNTENNSNAENGSNVPDSITVKFEASGNTPTPGLYYLRLLKEYTGPQDYSFACYHWKSGDEARVDKIEYDRNGNSIKVYGKPGNNNIALQFNKLYDDSLFIRKEQQYFTVKGTDLKTGSGMSYLWWLNGANHGTQVAPNYTVTDDNGETVIVWDIQQSGLADNMQGDTIMFSSYGKSINTVFGLTSSAHDNSATITDIGFYSLKELFEKYPQFKETMRYNVIDENSMTWQADNSISVNNAMFIKSFIKDEWNTLCLPLSVSIAESRNLFSEIKEFAGLTKNGEGELTLYFKDAHTITTGNVYLVKAKENMDYFTVKRRITETEGSPDAKVIDNVCIQGTYICRNTGPFAYVHSGNGFIKAANAEIKGLGMYITLEEEDWNSIGNVTLSFDDIPDGIKPVTANDESLIIYSIDGRKIKEAVNKEQIRQLPKGIYILKGEKIIVP